ncbi:MULTISPECIES: four helix bundle protein [unclassified Mesorhizobium]|uniref:four helix bundle protein n=1 Tax=unclassified Mesorhizobium TaxID=325217 RepID=UPI000FCB5C64|nr:MULTISPECIES: four helix bundle protein [unclassified Mesorhizobium]TGP25104.1 four helix bundle protein [Mesorhizobium sp. M1D.F.Ca.ET.231.01.1.1]TGP36427.1 four helix bundle protein [Mesorhizobium sp. M1D.F.Ca.ET.234.01.1.1]TGS49931.1 four helix bundle protein [Mesorhizobium sp. M1D.F.Ca.ET.184.01.1.1]TGS64642.1 four helix bundle protein [Mesorhizobium sp. M1D.F.Ca.ET.183.01.1.1]
MEKEGSYIKRAKDLEVYRRAYAVSLEVHKATLVFPKIEQYALADQMRRSSKAICANLAEGFAVVAFWPHFRLRSPRIVSLAKSAEDGGTKRKINRVS